jgi:hypothetical protein
MAALSANPSTPQTVQNPSKTRDYVVKTAEVIYDSALVGTDLNGDLIAMDDVATTIFAGVAEGGPVTGDDTATPPVAATVRDNGVVLEGVDVAGVSDRASINQVVYCATDNIADLSLTPTTNTFPIGFLIGWRSNTDMDVKLFTTAEYLAYSVTTP